MALYNNAELLTPLLDIVYQGRWVSVNRLTRRPGRTTDVFEVVTKESARVVAEIRWHAPWRKYVLVPRSETVWETTCLMDIARWLRLLTHERKADGIRG